MPDFDLVDQLSSMRHALGGAPTSLASYAPPSSTARPVVATGAGHDDHGHTASTQGGGGLVDFMGRKVSARVAPYMQKIATQFPGLRFTSGHRTAEANAAAKGVKNSRHLGGDAGDWVGSAGDMQRAQAWAKQNGAREALIHNVGSGQHLHVAW